MGKPTMTFHESYGEVSRAQLAAYRKHNVTPSEHDMLIEHFGEENTIGITAYVKRNVETNGGVFRIFDLYLGR